MLANPEAMAFEFATFCGNATEFMQVPQSASNLVDRSNDGFFAIPIHFIANHTTEHAGLRVRR